MIDLYTKGRKCDVNRYKAVRNQCRAWELTDKEKCRFVGRNAHLAVTIGRLEEGCSDEETDLIFDEEDLKVAGAILEQKLEECMGTSKKEKIQKLVNMYEAEKKERNRGF